MDIRNIEYFLHLAKYEHVSATADLLHISQPSLSKHITSLEREIGVKLFDRIGNRIVLNKTWSSLPNMQSRRWSCSMRGSILLNGGSMTPRGAFRSLILPMPPLSRTVSPSTPRSIP